MKYNYLVQSVTTCACSFLFFKVTNHEICVKRFLIVFFLQTFKWLQLTMPVGACNNVFRRISTGLNTMGARHSNSRCRTSSESELSRFTFVIKKNNKWNHLYTSINEMTGINRTVFSLLQSSVFTSWLIQFHNQNTNYRLVRVCDVWGSKAPD